MWTKTRSGSSPSLSTSLRGVDTAMGRSRYPLGTDRLCHVHLRYGPCVGANELASGLRRDDAPPLDDLQQRVLESMRRGGIAVVSFHELFGDDRLWADLHADIHDF